MTGLARQRSPTDLAETDPDDPQPPEDPTPDSSAGKLRSAPKRCPQPAEIQPGIGTIIVEQFLVSPTVSVQLRIGEYSSIQTFQAWKNKNPEPKPGETY